MLLTGCNSYQNAVGGDGAEDANFIQLFTVFMIVCTIMYLLVAAGLIAALWRRRRAALVVDDRKHHQTSPVVRPALAVWGGVIASAKVPQATITRIHAALMRALESPELRARLAEAGFEPSPRTSPEALESSLRDDHARNALLVRDFKIRAD